MRFPRSTRIFRGQLDVAPFAGVFFLLIIFLLLNASLVFVPGVPIQLPQAAELPGIEGPAVVVAVDASGQFYFDNQAVAEAQLPELLRQAAARFAPPQPVTLVVKADAQVKYDALVRLWLLARQAGLTNVLQATARPVLPTALPARP